MGGSANRARWAPATSVARRRVRALSAVGWPSAALWSAVALQDAVLAGHSIAPPRNRGRATEARRLPGWRGLSGPAGQGDMGPEPAGLDGQSEATKRRTQATVQLEQARRNRTGFQHRHTVRPHSRAAKPQRERPERDLEPAGDPRKAIGRHVAEKMQRRVEVPRSHRYRPGIPEPGITIRLQGFRGPGARATVRGTSGRHPSSRIHPARRLAASRPLLRNCGGQSDSEPDDPGPCGIFQQDYRLAPEGPDSMSRNRARSLQQCFRVRDLVVRHSRRRRSVARSVPTMMLLLPCGNGLAPVEDEAGNRLGESVCSTTGNSISFGIQGNAQGPGHVHRAARRNSRHW